MSQLNLVEPGSSRRISDRTSTTVAAILTALAYATLGRLSLLLSIPPGYATALWPAAGLALIAVVVWGRRAAWGVWFGSALVNVSLPLDFASETLARDLAVPVSLGIGAALQAMAGAWLVRRFVGYPTRLASVRSIVLLLALGGPVSCLVAASWGHATLFLWQILPSTSLSLSWFTWWVGDSVGVILVAPSLLLVAGRVASRRRLVPIVVPLLVPIILFQVVFARLTHNQEKTLQREFVRRCEIAQHALQAGFERQIDLVSAFESFCTSAPRLDDESIATFTQPLLDRYPAVLSLSWRDVDEHSFSAPRAELGGDQLHLSRPVYELAFDESRIRGYVHGVFDWPTLLRSSLPDLQEMGLTLTLSEMNPETNQPWTYTNGDAQVGEGNLTWSGIMAVADRTWSIRLESSPTMFSTFDAMDAWGILIGQFLFTSLLSAMLLTITGRYSLMRRMSIKVGRMNALLEEETDRRSQAENDIMAHAEELERSNQELEVNRRQLQEFVYTVSHDLKGPVVSIQGFARLLEEKASEELNDVTRGYLQRIVKNCRVMSNLLKDLLEISRIGSVPEEIVTIDVNAMVDEICQSASVLATERNVRLQIEDLPAIEGHPHAARQLFANLIENAIRHTPSGRSNTVGIGFDPEKEVFFVRDEGMGIPEDYHDRIFEVFSRLPNAHEGGTGVGLTICRRIVEVHNGSIWVESSLGEGATFFFTLPLAAPESVTSEELPVPAGV